MTNKSDGLQQLYVKYQHQKCFVGYRHQAAWTPDIMAACGEVLPEFDLEPWYADEHFRPTITLRDKVVEMIANARFGIYDISQWRDDIDSPWQLPRNVLIELGIAIALNRPSLLIRSVSAERPPISSILATVPTLNFEGPVTLANTLRTSLAQWRNVAPSQDWMNRFCIFGNRVCKFREEHPRASQWGHRSLRCYISDGLDENQYRGRPDTIKAKREEIRAALDAVMGRYTGVDLVYTDSTSIAEGYRFLLCSYCQTVRSTPLAIYRILPESPSEVFITIGISIALESLFGLTIPKVFLVPMEQELPSILRGYDVIESSNSTDLKQKLKTKLPALLQTVRQTAWKQKPLPFVDISRSQYSEFGTTEIQLTNQERSADLDALVRELKVLEDLSRMFEAATAGLLKLVRADRCSIMLLNSTTHELETKVIAGGDNLSLTTARTFRVGEGIAGYAAEINKPIHVPDVNVDPHFVVFTTSYNIGSLISFPITRNSVVYGVLNADSKEINHFTQEDERIIAVVTGQLAIALDATTRQDLFSSLSGLSIDEAMTKLLENATKHVGADLATVFAVNSETGQLERVRNFPSSRSTSTGPRADGLTRTILETGVPLSIPDVSSDPRVKADTRAEGIRSILGVPLKLKEASEDKSQAKPIGVLFLSSMKLRNFDDHDLALAQEIANLAAVAIKNAEKLNDAKSQTIVPSLARDSAESLDPLSVTRSLAMLMPDFEKEGFQEVLSKFWLNLENFYSAKLFTSIDPAVNAQTLELKQVLYEFIQEAILNALHHGNASSIECKLSISTAQLELIVTDNGTASDVDLIKQSAYSKSGIFEMVRRIEQLYSLSQFDLQTKKNGGGLIVSLTIPIDSKPSSKTSESRIAVAIIIRDPQGRVLLLKRGPAARTDVGSWENPIGEIEPSDEPISAARREVREELGITVELKELFTTKSPVPDLGEVVWSTHVFEGTVNELPIIQEPEKSIELRWVAITELESLPLTEDAQATFARLGWLTKDS